MTFLIAIILYNPQINMHIATDFKDIFVTRPDTNVVLHRSIPSIYLFLENLLCGLVCTLSYKLLHTIVLTEKFSLLTD